MKKLFVISLAIAVALTTSCGKRTNQEVPQKTLENFLDSICKLDFKQASQYCDTDIAEEFGAENIEDFKNSLISEFFGDDLQEYYGYAAKIVNPMVDGFSNSLKYDITESSYESDGEKWIFTVKISGIDLNEIYGVINSDGTSEIIDQVAAEYADRAENAKSETEQNELSEEMLGKMLKMMANSVEEACAESETIECEEKIEVIKLRDGWKVAYEDSMIFENLFSY